MKRPSESDATRRRGAATMRLIACVVVTASFGIAAAMQTAFGAPNINEIVVNNSNADLEFIELVGDPGESLDGLSLVEVAGCGDVAPFDEDCGLIIRAIDLSGNALLPNGTFVVGTQEAADQGVSVQLVDNGFFGVILPTSPQGLTFLLVDNFDEIQAGLGDANLDNNLDLDPDNNGVIGTLLLPWDALLDSVSFKTSAGSAERVYAEANETLVGTGSLPIGGFRDPDETGPFSVYTSNDVADYTPAFGDATIFAIQGDGDASPFVGVPGVVVVEGVVTADEGQGAAPALQGFFMQEAFGGDGDASTSDGIFVFEGGTPSSVNVGDLVTVTGTVQEFFGETQLVASSVTVTDSGVALPAPVTLSFPLATPIDDTLEPFEGMRVQAGERLFVTDTFNMGRFNEILLSIDGPRNQFTQDNSPGVNAFALFEAGRERQTITLDDFAEADNQDNGAGDNRFPVVNARGGNDLSVGNTLRRGDFVDNLTGVLGFSFGDYRIRAEGVNFQADNLRPVSPPFPGVDDDALKLVSFNVLNLFTTLDTGGNDCGPNDEDCRGANSTSEFNNQIAKLAVTLNDVRADVYAIQELENGGNGIGSDSDEAAIALAQAMDDAANAFCTGGVEAVELTGLADNFFDSIDRDVIRVSILFCSDRVSPVGGPEFLTDSDVPALLDSEQDVAWFDGDATSRTPMAVTFEDSGLGGGEFTVVSVHLKSKGSSGCTGLNCDQDDGQAGFNLRRTESAQAIAEWLRTNPTGIDANRSIVLGDFNAYPREDPIEAFEARGYTNFIDEFVGDETVTSLVFFGEAGLLDYAFGNSTISPLARNAAVWSINSDEPRFLDYNEEECGLSGDCQFSANDPFRSSDHDMVVLTIDRVGEIVGSGVGPNVNGTPRGDLFVLDSNGFRLVEGFGGRDVFYYESESDFGGLGLDIDFLQDFEVGVDKIDVSDLLRNIGYSGSNPFADGFLDLDAVGGILDGTNYLVDVDGPLGPEPFEVLGRARNVTLSQSDFIVE